MPSVLGLSGRLWRREGARAQVSPAAHRCQRPLSAVLLSTRPGPAVTRWPPVVPRQQRGPDRGTRKPPPGRPGVICRDIVVTGALRLGSPILCPQG